MTKQLKQQALYDKAVQALHELGLPPSMFVTMTTATYIAEATADNEQWDGEPSLSEYRDVLYDAGAEAADLELEEAWYLLEGHDREVTKS